jgi:glutamate/tyrosine decarboxylase-like PLP-dependent enzyme
MFFCRHKDAAESTFSVRADYMPKPQDDTYDPYHTSLQWTRRFMGLKLFMTLAETGEEGFSRLLDDQMELGTYFRELLTRNGWKLVNPTQLPVFCFTHPLIEGGAVTTDQVLKTLYAKGTLWISAVTLKNGQKAFRACLTNFNTGRGDLDFIVAELNRIISALSASVTTGKG